MKKTLAMLLVLALVAPAMAVEFTASDAGSGVLKIDYTLSSGEALRGLALKLTRTSGDAVVAAGTDVAAPAFNTFIDYAFSNAGYQIGQGHPVAKVDGAGVPAPEQFPINTFSISVGFLDQDGAQAGITDNGSITVQLTGTADSCFDIELDTLRGGVVGDNVVAPAAGWKINQCVAFAPVECVKTTAPFYADWVAWGKPDCWCYKKNCNGDTDGIVSGPFRVANPDLQKLLQGFNKSDTVLKTVQNGICADFDHVKSGPFRVANPDLQTLLKYFNKPDASVPVCDMTNYNFWKN